MKVDPRLNSGVQVRSHEYPAETSATIWNGKEFVDRKFPKGRFYGYQVKISNTKPVIRGHLRRSSPGLAV